MPQGEKMALLLSVQYSASLIISVGQTIIRIRFTSATSPGPRFHLCTETEPDHRVVCLGVTTLLQSSET